MLICLTGVGTRALLALARETGQHESLSRALQQMIVVARGPKPVAALKEAQVRIDVIPSVPTSEGILSAIEGRPLTGMQVAVQLYGEENPLLVDGLKARGATVHEIPLYEWALPLDQEPMTHLIHELLAGKIDVLAFTSSPQIRHLFEVAQRMNVLDRFVTALRDKVTLAVVGPVCEAVLVERGIHPVIQPEKPTMGALVHAIAESIAQEENQNVPGS
jgi:uroporphyrinogen-III synthase